MLFCCCSKARDDSTPAFEGFSTQRGLSPETLPGVASKSLGRILIEFVSEEARLGLREVQCLEIIEKVLIKANKNEVTKKDVVTIFKGIECINQKSIKHFLVQDFFFVDNTRVKYHLNKIIMFTMLYSGGRD